MSQTNHQTMRCWVSGRVQGVFFRASTQGKARELGLDGYAMNLPDGRVEVVARGPEAALESLRQWLRQGPPQARVDSLDCEAFAGPVESGFHTR
ncbi:acylphosphatase [Ectothiorhodospira haloalkaliphila]|uniref:Acylphosphatase n=1 Tax=Ectothiorhodospira haloalkaliphila TaxID=421628 RepID=W8KRR5_9GAMM|nr:MULTISPECIES: acylphosphatase [Ectothiorhodospira]AHK79677.1 acylphosphatase [Ectothiorhodospira haloalkaliphila]MCG5495743.1 acylphosphatase [Ectothiorhodospira variabilis]MCG5498679.1 acylphosphatase [Ectothiorhodospira variabilis]MCG5503241.1 acylphosphatase [Ectothiorhodospira variabilis]MCG5506000.1 acylphosphatase [Ectothiorhodospira variabilis]